MAEIMTVKIEAEEVERIVHDAVEAIKNDNDIVKVVRCKDCKYWNFIPEHPGLSKCGEHKMNAEIVLSCDDDHRIYTGPDFFCPYGERRDPKCK